MGEIRRIVPPAKMIMGLLVTDEKVRRDCLERITQVFGPIDLQSRVEPFGLTKYYCDEMGESIFRQYISIDRLIQMHELPAIKHRTNELELELAREDEKGRRNRQANIDPGYVCNAKLVLATTKDFSHRIYMADGIFAEVTLYYMRPEGFRPYPWSYPDYAREEVCQFFNRVRDIYRRQIRVADAPTDSSSAP